MTPKDDAAGEGGPLSDGRRKYFSVAEVADYFSISRQTAYQLVYSDKIRGHKFGGVIRVSRAEILRFEEESEMGRPR